MTAMQALVMVGGVYNLAFAAFHLSFWRLFGWRDELAKLSAVNRAIVQVLNLCLTFTFVMFGYVSLAHSHELVSTGLGRSLLGLVSVFWLLRAIEQVIFFRLRHWASWAFLVAFLAGALLHAYAAASGP